MSITSALVVTPVWIVLIASPKGSFSPVGIGIIIHDVSIGIMNNNIQFRDLLISILPLSKYVLDILFKSQIHFICRLLRKNSSSKLEITW